VVWPEHVMARIENTGRAATTGHFSLILH